MSPISSNERKPDPARPVYWSDPFSAFIEEFLPSDWIRYSDERAPERRTGTETAASNTHDTSLERKSPSDWRVSEVDATVLLTLRA